MPSLASHQGCLRAGALRLAVFSEFLTLCEGLCVQMLHVGPYDSEPESVALMDAFAAGDGYAVDISKTRLHHEIYLSDPRRTAPEKLRTVIRHPVKKLA